MAFKMRAYAPFTKETRMEGPRGGKTDYSVGDSISSPHPTYYNPDGTVNKGGTTGDFDEGELSNIKEDENGNKYVTKSADIGGGRLYIDKP